MSHDAAEIQKHVRTYIAVFVALAFLTIITVGVSYLHLTTAVAVTLALIIASIKASLVAAFFMHLVSEKKLITYILVITLISFVSMVLIIYFTDQGMMSKGL